MAITGVSRTPDSHGSNVVYKRLRERGYEGFAVNPNASQVEDDPADPDPRSIPGGGGGGRDRNPSRPGRRPMHECAELGITHVWMHRGPGGGSVSDAATAIGRDRGITVIDGGCPCMFAPTADPGLRAMRALLTLTGHAPRRV